MSYYSHNGRPGLYLEIGRRAMSRRCEMCGTPVDKSDYQDDGFRHTDGRCTEYLKAALGAANRHAEGLAKLTTHLQSELDQQRGHAETAEHKLTQIRAILENYANDEHFSAWNAIGAIEELKP